MWFDVTTGCSIWISGSSVIWVFFSKILIPCCLIKNFFNSISYIAFWKISLTIQIFVSCLSKSPPSSNFKANTNCGKHMVLFYSFSTSFALLSINVSPVHLKWSKSRYNFYITSETEQKIIFFLNIDIIQKCD